MAWPRSVPLAALWSARPRSETEARWTRWSIFAVPSTVLTRQAGEDALASVGEALAVPGMASKQKRADEDAPPFCGGWIVTLSYELGTEIEPAARVSRTGEAASPWPRATMFRCGDAYIHDGWLDRWWVTGDAGALPPMREVEGAVQPRPYSLELAQEEGRAEYVERVRRAIEYIRAGDIFQANIARSIRGRVQGSTRGLWGAMLAAAEPWYGAYLEWDGRAILSASPELFLRVDGDGRRVVTRPIKGTRPGDAGPRELRECAKDRAELDMIIDLMRNDLGRVCEYGSVQVAEAFAIERHARGRGGTGVLHGVATIGGRLKEGVDAGKLLAATFPAGSITGAPKVRAMQIIDELEGSPRGPYTGSIGYFSDCGNACLNVAIRTAAIRGGELSFGVGAGIVADSDPQREWEETVTKASVLAAAAEAAEASSRMEGVQP